MTGERPGTPGARWEARLAWGLETVVPEDDGNPFAWDEPRPGEARPNRATRRAVRARERRARARMARRARDGATGAQAGAQTIETKET